MQQDKTTLKDLSVFAPDTGNIFQLLEYTVTQAGKDRLKEHLLNPPADLETLIRVQDTVKYFFLNNDVFPAVISNGTLVMLEKFFESADMVSQPGGINLMFGPFLQKIFNRNEYFFTEFSISHLSDFLKGCTELVALLEEESLPAELQEMLQGMQLELEAYPLVNDVMKVCKDTPYKQLVRLSFQARRILKGPVYRMMWLYTLLDARQAMSKATKLNGWIFPDLLPSSPIHMHAKGLYHPLLKSPVSYDVHFTEEKNFLMLTGANMSGKTTFMRTLGVGALLAHAGLGVPAKAYSICFMQGIITNMYVEDNLVLGESFFFAEVQRVKQTAQKLLQPLPHLVLMDELFKGTNVLDAYECTKAVVDGLVKHKKHIMILSTHLYEVAQYFSSNPGIQFAYFVTKMNEAGGYTFNYEMKEGVSDDRIGYRILEQEGVLKLLSGAG